MHVANRVGEVSAQFAACRSFEKAPRVPIVGASAVFKFNDKLHFDLLSLDDLIAWRAMDAPAEFPLLVPARSEAALGAWGAFCGARNGVFGHLKCGQVDEGGRGT